MHRFVKTMSVVVIMTLCIMLSSCSSGNSTPASQTADSVNPSQFPSIKNPASANAEVLPLISHSYSSTMDNEVATPQEYEYEYIYDEQGHSIGSTVQDNTFRVYEYDDKGNVTMWGQEEAYNCVLDDNGKISSFEVHPYGDADPKGTFVNLTRVFSYKDNGTIESVVWQVDVYTTTGLEYILRQSFNYDEKGFPTSVVSEEARGEEQLGILYGKQVDKNATGNRIVEGDLLGTKITVEFTYEEQGSTIVCHSKTMSNQNTSNNMLLPDKDYSLSLSSNGMLESAKCKTDSNETEIKWEYENVPVPNEFAKALAKLQPPFSGDSTFYINY